MRITYDGTNYYGWQIQKKGRTVQQTIEEALSEIAKRHITVIGSGRTDAGVHAFRQYAHFDFPTNMNSDQIQLALRTKLPLDISITKVQSVTPDFHARYDAVKRIYQYIITDRFSPFERLYSVFVPPKNLKEDLMKKCTDHFLGEHDFTSFCKQNPDIKNNVCNITSCTLIRKNEKYIFEISANRFLHNMVRRIIGTIVNISRTNTDPKIILTLFAKKDPSHKLISTFPAQGLFLWDVKYPSV